MSKRILEVELDTAELTLRIAETCLGMKRPPNASAAEALALLRASLSQITSGFDRAANRVAAYFVACINRSGDWAEIN